MGSSPESGLPNSRQRVRATSLDSALAFYGELFGWRKGETMDMGPNGVYQLFATGAQGDNDDGSWIVLGLDSQGAAFAVVGPR